MEIHYSPWLLGRHRSNLQLQIHYYNFSIIPISLCTLIILSNTLSTLVRSFISLVYIPLFPFRNFFEGKKSASWNPPDNDCAWWISVINSFWSLHTFPNADLHMEAFIHHKSFCGKLIGESTSIDAIDDRRVECSSCRIRLKVLTILALSCSKVDYLRICLQLSPYGENAISLQS